jgi:hypothetical protein
MGNCTEREYRKEKREKEGQRKNALEEGVELAAAVAGNSSLL